jgi:hypothetical protein
LTRLGQLNDPLVTHSEISTSYVSFSWNPVEGATDYVIELQDADGNWVRPLKLPATTTSSSYYPHEQKFSTVFTYRLRALEGNVSSPGTVISLTTPAN